MSNISIKVITQEDIASIFHKNTDRVFEIVENAFRKYVGGEVMFPDKISQIFDSASQNRINCMPATLLKDRVCGLKWVSVFPANAAKKIQNVTGIMLLSEIATGFPIAVMDGTLCTKLRTAAVGCVAAKYLAPRSVRTVGFIGAGEEAKMHFILLKHLFPGITTCKVSSRKKATEEQFIETFRELVPDVTFCGCEGDTSAAVDEADIIITAISGQAPVLKAADIKRGSLYIHVGGWEDEYGVAQKAHKIVCDDWEASKHRTQTICRMYKEGLLKDEDIYANLSDIISGRKPGREHDDEFIYFNSVGLSYIDLNFANEIYNEACRRHLGSDVVLAEKSDTDYSSFL